MTASWPWSLPSVKRLENNERRWAWQQASAGRMLLHPLKSSSQESASSELITLLASWEKQSL